MPQIPEPPVPVADPQPTPLTRYPLQDINTPCQTDGFYVELVSRTDEAFTKFDPMARGTPYATIPGARSQLVDQYAGNPLYFLKQTSDVDSMRVLFNSAYDNYVIWIWATQTLSQNATNARVTYVDEALLVPRFERVSTTKRQVYETTPALSFQSALTALVSVAITAHGTGYGAPDANGRPVPTVGTVGNAMALGVVDSSGGIIDWVVTVEGVSITSGAALTITGSGTGATATARIQPAGAILLHQEKRELPEGDPLSHDYVEIVQTWETVPGATLTQSHYDAGTNTIVTEAKTKKLISAITPGATTTGSGTGAMVVITTEEPIDANTSFEVVTRQPLPTYHDLASALVTKRENPPFEFPATLDVDLYVSSTGALGYAPAFVRRVTQVTFTYWVINAVAPDVDSEVNGIPILAGIWGLTAKGVGTIPEVIMNAKNITYAGGTTIAWPGSTPNLTDYLADWVGGDPRCIHQDVSPDGDFFRWRVDLTFVQFLVEPQGVIVP